MRRFLLVALAAAVGSLAAAGVSGAQTPTQDSVTGSGTSRFCGGEFTIDAHSGPSGENPTGDVTCGTLFSGPVTCLNVTDNVALVTVQTGVLFGPVALIITDLGPTGDTLFARPGSGCPTPLMDYMDFEISGDLKVVDAQPLPTSKDQCKNGGWRTYGVFKNQGDCVSFVATGGQNPPSGP